MMYSQWDASVTRNFSHRYKLVPKSSNARSSRRRRGKRGSQHVPPRHDWRQRKNTIGDAGFGRRGAPPSSLSPLGTLALSGRHFVVDLPLHMHCTLAWPEVTSVGVSDVGEINIQSIYAVGRSSVRPADRPRWKAEISAFGSADVGLKLSIIAGL